MAFQIKRIYCDTMEEHEINQAQSEWKTGWMIVMSAFFLAVLTDGFVYSFGLLLVELSEYFDEERATVAVILAILTSVQFITGLVTDTFGKKYGYRVMAIAGSVVTSIGFISSCFATSIYYLWISYGVVGGVGIGLTYSAAIVCVLQHFKQHRSLAMGITTSGTGVGIFIMNFCCRVLFDYYQWRGSLLMQAGIALQGVIFGLLLAGPFKKDTEQVGCRNSIVNSIKDVIKSCFRKELLTDLKWILFLISNFMSFVALSIPFAFIPDQVKQDGLSKTEAAVLVSSIGIATTISRLLFGWFGDRLCFRRAFLLIAVELINGLLTGVSPFMTTFEFKLAYTIMFGSLVGAYFSVVFVVLADIVRTELVASALGLLFLTFGISSIVALPLAGFLFDQTGSYQLTFMFSGAGFIIGGILLLVSQLFPLKDCKGKDTREVVPYRQDGEP